MAAILPVAVCQAGNCLAIGSKVEGRWQIVAERAPNGVVQYFFLQLFTQFDQIFMPKSQS